MKLVTVEQMRSIESAAFASGATPEGLMETAGTAMAAGVREKLGGARARRVLVLVGPGNNGGDGLVAARHLYDAGAEVQVCLLGRRGDGDDNLRAVRERDIDLVELDESNARAYLEPAVARADVAIDAVLGTGPRRPLSGVIAETFESLKSRRCRLFAIDLPTGVDADTGAVDEHAARADVTFTLGFSKLGLHLLPGSTYAGEVEVLDIGLDSAAAERIEVEMMTSNGARAQLPERPFVSNKGTFGRVLVVAGSESYTGAAILCCLGALRAGAGLVTLACVPAVRAAASAQLAEVTFLKLPVEDDDFSPEAGDTVVAALPAYDVLLIGPGLGQSPGAQALMLGVLSTPAVSDVPAVVDADGLNALAKLPDWHEIVACNAVLTPHPGELARLMRVRVDEAQADRLETARSCATAWNQTLVLKGAQTVVASPQGAARISPFANAALATAGTGDVLAGTIAGLLAQGVDQFKAAGLGVYLHGEAAELFGQAYGSSGLLASELGAGIARAAAALRRANAEEESGGGRGIRTLDPGFPG